MEYRSERALKERVVPEHRLPIFWYMREESIKGVCDTVVGLDSIIVARSQDRAPRLCRSNEAPLPSHREEHRKVAMVHRLLFE
jgi:hypothetical protein